MMPRRHRNVLLKFLLFLPLLYFLSGYFKIEDNEVVSEKQLDSNNNDSIEEIKEEPEVKRKEDKDIVLDIPLINKVENNEDKDDE